MYRGTRNSNTLSGVRVLSGVMNDVAIGQTVPGPVSATVLSARDQVLVSGSAGITVAIAIPVVGSLLIRNGIVTGFI